MPDILLNRETVILTAPSDALFPRNDLYPADDLYPYGEVREVTNIVAGSLKLDSLLAEKSIQFGQFYATKFEVQVYNEEDLSGRYIHVYQREGNVYHDLFTGVIDSCKVDKIGTDRTIVAYDKAYVTRQMNVADLQTLDVMYDTYILKGSKYLDIIRNAAEKAGEKEKIPYYSLLADIYQNIGDKDKEKEYRKIVKDYTDKLIGK